MALGPTVKLAVATGDGLKARIGHNKKISSDNQHPTSTGTKKSPTTQGVCSFIFFYLLLAFFYLLLVIFISHLLFFPPRPCPMAIRESRLAPRLFRVNTRLGAHLYFFDRGRPAWSGLGGMWS